MATTTRKSKRRIEQEAALAEWVESIPDEYVECRDLGHAKTKYRTFGVSDNYYGRRIECRRCGYAYSQIIHRDVIIWTGDVSYPADYLKPPGATPGRVDRAIFRRELIAQSVIETDGVPDAMIKAVTRLKNRNHD